MIKGFKKVALGNGLAHCRTVETVFVCVEGRMGRAGECQEAACLGKEPRGLEQSS